jgi:hypothetical protein
LDAGSGGVAVAHAFYSDNGNHYPAGSEFQGSRSTPFYTAHTSRDPFRPLRSVGPVFQVQSRDLAEVAQVSGDESRSLREGDAGDQKVGSTDLFQVFDLSEPVELGGGLGVEVMERPRSWVAHADGKFP